ncbi:primase C-terminal domain-containing protein [Flavonifractor plautii]|uniref:primase C-terminal domain-containing protein n=1 Tax=Flavonifractor plautii TaxID=292800 RepID=UPI001D08ACE8|nr:primase C-terminal domain-containing protein [Flavonifractor plautii]MCB7358108.1 primase C-terminal domain-containing protein [Flavonifractor plautii]
MYEKIPSELKEKAQWVNVWNSSKVPMQTGQKKAASSVLPDTWGTFDCAVLNVANGIYDGIGYVFNDDGLIGIDIDDGFSEGLLNPLASNIISHCGSYTEKSRSGRGVHILLKGSLPFKGRNNRAGVEIYRSGRYFIMTGKVIIYSEIIENQEAIDYIVSRYFPDVPKEGAGSSAPQRIYSPIYRKPEPGKIALKPEYPTITTGSRNLSLTSLAGQMHNQGYSKAEIYKELLYANTQACKPPLPRSEIKTIVNSVTRYRR